MNKIFSMKMAVIMLFIFGFVIGAATFIENDYGTQTAQALVYKARWFEVFMGYFVLILIYNMAKYKSHKTKPAVFLFHASFLVVAIGAAMTRYVGYEGIMHIREGSVSSKMVSDVKTLQVQATHGIKQVELVDELYLSSWGLFKNNISNDLSVGGKEVNIELLDYMPTAHYEVIKDEVNGREILEFKIAAGGRGEEYYVTKGTYIDLGTFYIAYDATNTPLDKSTFNIRSNNGSYSVDFPFGMQALSMDTQESKELESGTNDFTKRVLYQFSNYSIVLKDIHQNSYLKLDTHDIKTQAGKSEYMKWRVTVGNEYKDVVTRPRRGQQGAVKSIELNGVKVDMRVGARNIPLPFSLKLADFQLERYPGSMTPSSYASEVVLIDEEKGINMPYRIYMNHVLDHRNYRFFQSSYDQDEKGTVLSVNHDPGTIPTYIGYAIMTIAMFWALFTKNGRFQQLLHRTRKLQSAVASMMFVAVLSTTGSLEAATPTLDSKVMAAMQAYNKDHADKFAKLATQDHQGRMKPVDTLASEVIAKMVGKSYIYGLTSVQLFLGMTMQPDLFQTVPLIKIAHKKVALQLGLDENTKLAKFSDFFNASDYSYKLSSEINNAVRKKPLDQSQYDKELIKVDERVNVAYMTYQGSLLQIFPKPNDVNNKWMAPMNAIKEYSKDDAILVQRIISIYFQSVAQGIKTGNWGHANEAITAIEVYQNKFGSEVKPSDSLIEWEIKYNKFGLFAKLVPLYLLLGLVLVVLAFINVIKPKFSLNLVMKVSLAILIIGFVLHVFGLGVRWYISGHAPWSNAYEAVVFIAASTVFAGILLARQSPFALAGTALLSGITMGVAHMSFMNPEITNLVPVLKSYWLMIHVATIISGDGFLGLGSMLSLLVMILYIIRKNGNDNIDRSIKELTNLSEMALIVGLFLLTIGNFLGGVWANESWGRYWGWDAKETWAAVTILVYAFVLHFRFVPSLKSNFLYNAASMWSYSTVLMTYFGVNYYLSGLHSYAAGDPIPIPQWIYWAVAGLAVLTLLAARNRKTI